MKIILLVLIILCCSCVSQEARKNQSKAVVNIYHAVLALERGVNPSIILPRIKSQAILILNTNKDTSKGMNNGN